MTNGNGADTFILIVCTKETSSSQQTWYLRIHVPTLAGANLVCQQTWYLRIHVPTLAGAILVSQQTWYLRIHVPTLAGANLAYQQTWYLQIHVPTLVLAFNGWREGCSIECELMLSSM